MLWCYFPPCELFHAALDPQTVVFPVGSAAMERRCLNITFNQSTSVESFSIGAESNDPNVGFSPGGAMAMVTIINNDSKRVVGSSIKINDPSYKFLY